MHHVPHSAIKFRNSHDLVLFPRISQISYRWNSCMRLKTLGCNEIRYMHAVICKTQRHVMWSSLLTPSGNVMFSKLFIFLSRKPTGYKAVSKDFTCQTPETSDSKSVYTPYYFWDVVYQQRACQYLGDNHTLAFQLWWMALRHKEFLVGMRLSVDLQKIPFSLLFLPSL